MFPDGRAYVLTFNQVEQRYYAAFVDEFPEADVSISQWRGGYEYQTLYPAIQMMVENGIQTLDALNEILGVIAATNQSIYRPAVLQSRVAERFTQAGYEATARVADINTRGIVAICVDQERNPITRRVMNVATNPADATISGFSSSAASPYGSLTPITYSTTTITDFFAGSAVTAFRFAAPVDDSVAPVIRLDSGGVYPLAKNPENTDGSEWVSTDPALMAAIHAALGGELKFSLEAEGDGLAVNNDDAVIGNLIRDEMLPAGQHMEGDIVYPTALSNGQALDIRWRIPAKTTHEFRTTIQRARGSQYPMHSVDEIIIIFNANYAEQMGIGRDITPATYLTTSDLKWAAAVTTEWSADGGATWASTVKTAQYFDQFLAELDPANVVIV